MPASWRVFIHAARHCSSVPYSRSNSASVSPCMIARIGPIPLLVGGDSALIPSTIVERVDWLISGITNHAGLQQQHVHHSTQASIWFAQLTLTPWPVFA